MKRIKKINKIKKRRKARVRAKIAGTAVRPRLSVFRSNRHIFAQLIDDAAGKTLVSFSSQSLKKKEKLSKSMIAEMVGKSMAEEAVKQGITQAVLDKGPYRFHGRIKALTESARKAGLKI